MSAPWFYDAGGRQAGPLDEEMIKELIRMRDVRETTLVWREGMAGWQPVSAVPELAGALPVRPPRPAVSQAAPPPPQPFTPAATVATPAPSQAASPAAGSRFCASCGRAFPEGEMIQYMGAHICADCKPAYFQRMREGVAPGGSGLGGARYAGFWIRFAAKFIDGLVIGIPVFIVYFAVMIGMGVAAGAASRQGPNPAAMAAMQGMNLLLQLGFYFMGALYSAFMHSKYGATLGKMAVGVKVVTLDGVHPSFGRAFGRGCSEILSGFCCYVGYIIAAFDGEKRALHDHIASTRVIHK